MRHREERRRAPRRLARRADRARAQDRSLRVDLNEIEVSNKHGLQFGGRFYYRGFEGELTGKAPFTFKDLFQSDKPLQIDARLEKRQLKTIASLVNGIDEKRSQGEVSGSISISGSADSPKIGGSVRLDARSLAGKGIDSALRDVSAEILFKDQQGVCSFRASGERKGLLSGSFSTGLVNAKVIVEELAQGNLNPLINTPLSGKLASTDFAIRQGFERGSFIQGEATANLEVKGTVGRPEISGKVVLGGVDTVLPSLESSANSESSPLIDPIFNIDVEMPKSGRFRSSVADVRLLGSGGIRGSLTRPDVDIVLDLEKGAIRLPGGNLKLDTESEIRVGYHMVNGKPEVTAPVSIVGRTSVTAQRFGDQIERYEVTVTVTGDAVKQNGLTLSAESNPADLSKEKILALLGQTDVFGNSTGAALSQNETEKRVRDALVGYALPQVLDPLTRQFAQGFGLEYLSVEYNRFDQASVVFGKFLGKGLSLQGRRQISVPLPGYPTRFDWRLVYRLPNAKGSLRRFSLTFGADELRPWKFTIEYGVKF